MSNQKKKPPDYVLMFAGVWSASLSATAAGLTDFCGRVAFSIVFAVISLAAFAELFERKKETP